MTRIVLLSLVLMTSVAKAAPMPLAEARALVEKGAFDEVYLAFSSLKAGAHPEGDRALSALLVDTARRALSASDPSLALGLSDTARKVDPKSVEACLANAEAAEALDQRAAAESALDAALALAPSDGEVLYLRGDYAAREGQLAKAVELLRRIPKGHGRAEAGRTKADEAEGLLKEEMENLSALRKAESDQKELQRIAAEALTSGQVVVPPQGAVPAGSEIRSSRYFRIVYQGNARDFAERAKYEQRVLELFEKAHEKVGALLGRRFSVPTDVVLYTEEEFRHHFGDMFGGSVLGFYAGKIRMNRAEKLDDAFYATAVHEYAHAAVDTLARGQIGRLPRWMNEGLARWIERRVIGGDFVSRHELTNLRSLANSSQLPSLSALEKGAFTQPGSMTWVAYAKSSAAIEALSSGGSLGDVVRVVEAVGSGESFESAFAARFGAERLGRLDAEIERLVDR